MLTNPFPAAAQTLLQWNGNINGNWDINSTANWLLGATPTVYTNGAAVNFGDGASTTAVSLTTTLQPASITVSNTAKSYTFGGGGSLAGSAGLTKLGTNTLSLANLANTYTGPTVLSNGTVVATGLANGGSPSPIGASSANPTNLVLAGGALSYQGASAAINRGYLVASGGALDVQGNLRLTGQVTASGGNFTKSGPATLTYGTAGANQLSAGGGGAAYAVGAGTVVFDGSAGGQTNTVTGEFWVGHTTANAAALIVSNSTLNVSSWLAIGRGNGTVGFSSSASLYNSTVSCANLSLGYWAGVAGNLQSPSLTLNGASQLFVNGGTGFNLSESGGSSTTVQLNDNSFAYSAQRVLIGMATGATGTLVIATSAALTNGNYASIGAPGVGFVTLKNNAVWQELGDFNVADTSGAQGTLNVQNNAQLIIATLYVGKSVNSTGIVYQTGGTVMNNGGGEWRIGGNVNGGANQSGIYNLSGGIFSAGGNCQVGAYGSGSFNQSGGSASVGGWPSIGRFAGGNGALNVSGGTFNQASSGTALIIGESGTGTLTVSGSGVVNMATTLRLGQNSGASGTVNLNGGTIITKQVYLGNTGASGVFNFNGGTLRAAPGAPTDFMSGLTAAYVQVGGVILDTGTNAITIAQDLNDAGGGLTKLGSGTLTLAGNANYSGATAVNNGTLLVTAPASFASSGCAVNAGATFGVTLASANAQISVPTLSFAAAGSGLAFNFGGLGAQTTPPLSVTTLSVNGPITVSVAGFNFAIGQYPLIHFSSRAGAGSFTLGPLPNGMSAQLLTNVPNQTIDLLVTSPSSNPPWQPKQAPLMTDWAQQVNPTNVLAEYPRPQMQRTNWLNLNGVWQFQPGAASDPLPTGQNLSGQILVPFPMESALSGVMQYNAYSWYRRTFTVPAGWNGKRVILHLDAVTWQSQVYVNGQSVGIHNDGYDPFSYDITPYLTGGGPQELIVRVYSPEDNGSQPRGKQTLYPGGIMYTSASGIWQPVWLEPVPISSIGVLHLVPDIDNNRLLVNVAVIGATNGLSVNAVAYDGTNQVGNANGSPGNNFFIAIPSPKLWCPTNPFLYNLQVSLTTNSTALDSVASYFGMRKISIGTNNGFLKMYLNNQFVFEIGPLDQGFWPDGIYTAPTDLALKSDIEVEKALGFNMIRKHIKVERQRWYYWADTLGMLVWQDMPSCNSYTGNPNPPAVDPLQFIAELTAMVTNHWNSPAIIMWDIFNEGQGQAGSGNGVGQTNTAYLVQLVKSLDPSRLVNQASGGNYAGVGDVLDEHSYPNPGVPSSSSQAVACGEYGGVGLGITNHTWASGWGYVAATNGADLTAQFQGFCGLLTGFITDNGLSAAVYTQITDVETELNGLKTYDRKVLKPDLRGMQTAIAGLMGQYGYTVIVPTSQTNAQSWKYTFTTPAANWFTNGFDDSLWTNGFGAFGTAGTPGISPNTTWNTSDIWLRRTFNPGPLTTQQISNLAFKVYHDEDCEIYINGVLAASASGYVTAYSHLAMSPAGQAAVLPNASNLLAVHCHQTTGGQGIDVGVDATTVIVPPPPVFVPNWTENGTGLVGEYFNDTTLSNLVFLRADTNVNFNWSASAPGPGLSNHHFSVRWTSRIQPRYTEGYTFHLTTSDGCRLWVNGQLLIDKWHDDTNTDATGSIALTGGQRYDLRIEYYNNTNPASAILEWNSASQTREIVPGGVLFPNPPPAPMLGSPQFHNGQFTLTVSGIPGSAYYLDLATNLAVPVFWRPVFTNPATAILPFVWTDPTASNSPQRFYRARLGP